MSSELVGPSHVGQLPRGLARATKREIDEVVARAEIARTVDMARALLTSGAINNVTNLTAMSEQLVQVSPAAGPHLRMLLTSYTAGASEQIMGFRG